jgi:glycerol-3-phosphate acyltransferase PlsX
MIKIGLDIFGGDNAPEATIDGAILATNELPEDAKLVCIGDKDKIESYARSKGFNPGVWEIVHTTSQIEMGDNPSKAFQQKQDASIPLGFKLLKSKKIDGFASAGNTGAMMVGAMMVVKAIHGVIRPAIASFIPTTEVDIPILLLDVGINPDAKPEVMVQYGIMGALYVKHVFNIDNPRVALLNIGSEEEKGNLLTKATYPLMKNSKFFNFVGNVEGHDFFSNKKTDVMVCDGFVGNILLKSLETIYDLVKKRNIHDTFFEKFNYENFGGTPILGINGVAVIGHGISNDKAIKNMILQTYHVTQANLIEKLKMTFKEYSLA